VFIELRERDEFPKYSNQPNWFSFLGCL